MTVLAWVLSEAAFRRFLNELRSRTPDGSGPAPDRRDPQASSGDVAGGDARTPRPVDAALPPAPCRLAGAVGRAPAPARPPRVMVHG